VVVVNDGLEAPIHGRDGFEASYRGVGITLEDHLESMLRIVQQGFQTGVQYDGETPIYVVNYLVDRPEPQHATTIVKAETPRAVQQQITDEIQAAYGHVHPNEILMCIELDVTDDGTVSIVDHGQNLPSQTTDETHDNDG